MSSGPGVLFVGLATVDLLYGIDRLPGSNEKVVAAWQEVCAGGPATNAAVACAHLGGRAVLATAVGDHPMAAIVRDDLARHGVALVDLAPGLELVPPVSSVFVDQPTGDRAVVSANAAAWPARLLPVPESALDGGRVLLVDGHYVSTAIPAARRARVRGLVTVMDGGSWKPGTEDLLPHIDMAICSADFRPPGCGTAQAVADRLRAAGVRAVAVTRGREDVLCWDGSRTGSIPVPRVEVVDTLGAGDVLHGAFCHAIASGAGSFLDAVEVAVLVAAHSCAHRGTRAWMDDAGRAGATPGSPR